MKLVFWGVFAAGFAACTAFGIGPVLKRVGGSWLSPWMLAGIVLGVAILALAAAFLLGVRAGRLGSEVAYVLALALLIALKVGVGVGSVLATASGRG